MHPIHCQQAFQIISQQIAKYANNHHKITEWNGDVVSLIAIKMLHFYNTLLSKSVDALNKTMADLNIFKSLIKHNMQTTMNSNVNAKSSSKVTYCMAVKQSSVTFISN